MLATSLYHWMEIRSETEDVLETKVCWRFHLYEIVAVLETQLPAFTHSSVLLVGCLILVLVLLTASISFSQKLNIV